MYQAAIMGAGLALNIMGQARADADQADAEERNAAYYREQAAYAAKVGERQQDIFDRESKILVGDQMSAFAKAGVNTQSSSLFMAKEMLFRQEESNAIKVEADQNVRLAMLRADSAQSTADALNDPTNKFLKGAGTALSGLGSVL